MPKYSGSLAFHARPDSRRSDILMYCARGLHRVRTSWNSAIRAHEGEELLQRAFESPPASLIFSISPWMRSTSERPSLWISSAVIDWSSSVALELRCRRYVHAILECVEAPVRLLRRLRLDLASSQAMTRS
jgi:hypothetical protein